jgi:tetratricopeptide (TPR) repeat protein
MSIRQIPRTYRRGAFERHDRGRYREAAVGDQRLIEEYLEKGGWSFERIGKQIWRSSFEGENRFFPFTVHISEDVIHFTIVPFISSLGDSIGNPLLVRELLKMNGQMKLAKFMINDLGEIGLAVEFPAGHLDYEEFKSALDSLTLYADRHYSHLMDFLREIGAPAFELEEEREKEREVGVGEVEVEALQPLEEEDARKAITAREATTERETPAARVEGPSTVSAPGTYTAPEVGEFASAITKKVTKPLDTEKLAEEMEKEEVVSDVPENLLVPTKKVEKKVAAKVTGPAEGEDVREGPEAAEGEAAAEESISLLTIRKEVARCRWIEFPAELADDFCEAVARWYRSGDRASFSQEIGEKEKAVFLFGYDRRRDRGTPPNAFKGEEGGRANLFLVVARGAIEVEGSRFYSDKLRLTLDEIEDWLIERGEIAREGVERLREADDLYRKGLSKLEEKQLIDAEDCFQAVLNQNPVHYEACYRLGLLHQKEFGHYHEAIQFFNRALSLQPTAKEVLLSRAKAYITVGAFEKAKADYAQAHELEPHNPEIIYSAGLACFDAGDIEEARKYWLKYYRLAGGRAVQALLRLPAERDGEAKWDRFLTIWEERDLGQDMEDPALKEDFQKRVDLAKEAMGFLKGFRSLEEEEKLRGLKRWASMPSYTFFRTLLHSVEGQSEKILEALGSLFSAGGDRAVETLEDALRSKSPKERKAALTLAKWIEKASLLDVALAAFEVEFDEDTLTDFVEYLSVQGDKRAFIPLLEKLERHYAVCRKGLVALAKREGKPLVRLLINALADKRRARFYSQRRQQIALALGEIGDSVAKERLKEMHVDPQEAEAARDAAAQALDMFPPEA